MLTFEDGWNTDNEVDQRYGVYDTSLGPVLPYPHEVSPGGHSGHVAAGGNRFIVAYSSGWVDGGGVDGLGSGYGVYASIYNSYGHREHHVRVAPLRREWWPLVAAAPRAALIVWQGYVKGQTYARLKAALVDLKTGKVDARQTLRDEIRYYTYAIGYLADLDRFLVVGTAQNGRGFADLIDGAGRIVAQVPCMPPIVREEGIAVAGDTAYAPAADDRLLRLQASASSLALTGVQASPLIWSTVGSVGLPDGRAGIHWFSLGKSGLREADFNAKTFAAPSPQDLCR